MTGDATRDDHPTPKHFNSLPVSDYAAEREAREAKQRAREQREAAKAARSPYWHGMLCTETRDEIAERMREVLGDHYFTMVICNSYDENSDRFSSVEVYPSQWLTSPVDAWTDQSSITWCTPRLSMGVHTRAKTQADGRAGRPHQYAHLKFEPDRIEIDHYAPAGYRLLWILAVERHDPGVGET